MFHKAYPSKLRIFLASLVFLAALPLASAQAGNLIQHEMGETEVPDNPQRIVVLEFSFVDALVAVGITPVGLADDNKGEAGLIPEISSKLGEWTPVGSRKQPSLEVISSLNPDLIIADLQRHEAIVGELNGVAPTIVLRGLQGTYEDNVASMSVIGEALGLSDQMEKRIAEHRSTIEALAAKVPASESRTVLPAVVWADGFNAHASSSYTGELLEKIGFKNAIQSEPGTPYATMTLENLIAIDPDVIFLMKYSDVTIVDGWKTNPLWGALKAVQNNQIHVVRTTLWAKFRGMIAAEIIAADAIKLLY
jgi:ABC-type Fe3+-citrate transport system substrate-binding protein